MSDLKLQSGDKVLFIGDSITDCGRRTEAGAPLGGGYVRMAANLITAKYPGRDVEFVNRGIGGNTVLDLQGRWQEDAIDVAPTWLSVMIGINDVHRCCRGDASGPDAKTFDSVYEKILDEMAEKVGPKMILCEPFYLCSDPNHDINIALRPYFDTVHRLAEKFDAALAPVHQAFQEALKRRPDPFWSGDNVHPVLEGHALIALQWLEAMNW